MLLRKLFFRFLKRELSTQFLRSKRILVEPRGHLLFPKGCARNSKRRLSFPKWLKVGSDSGFLATDTKGWIFAPFSICLEKITIRTHFRTFSRGVDVFSRFGRTLLGIVNALLVPPEFFWTSRTELITRVSEIEKMICKGACHRFTFISQKGGGGSSTS